ncbi:Gfo/Idh/MocA family protein [Roseibium sediminicola]|uniref:Gfo/Idh/MocA family oxidoreductase n=1 Tax=Roseibium sediminicola TaxID=2933272 RepID=A0ABT0H047_9HYPH|nr:Gfo/Idh/MocA family oxidoreductase [Roseibium sp. CAU 1639]MCK7615062.1 Gfo/Idh/MocA family oxidoreductase [Roseibium sp. CAU 1639]
MSKLTWAMIGGGKGSQIGPTHRISAGLDGHFHLVASALDADPERGKAFAIDLGIAPERAYGSWQEMLEEERDRSDRPDLVTVATPNATHYEITSAFLTAGFDVLCEKPLTMTTQEAERIVAITRETGRVCAVNYGYSGYPLVRQMRAMVAAGDLGRIRLIKAEFAHGFHADAEEADNPRVRWRYDPAQAGVSAVFADAGIHAFHMACFVSGQAPREVSADFASLVGDRQLEDDAMLNIRLDGGALCRLWTSAVAIGRMHGLTLQVFGEKGGLSWQQQHPEQLLFTPLGGRTQILERGDAGLSAEAVRASRIPIGHAEGMPVAFANIYHDLADVLRAKKAGRAPDPLALHYPTAEDGLLSMRAIAAAANSAGSGGRWTDI